MHSASKTNGIPPHRGIVLPGVHAYTEEKSVAAGNTIRFHVSSDVPYLLSICKPVKVGDDSSDVVLKAFPRAEPKVQPIHPGSYIVIDRGLPADQGFDNLTLELWVKPWQLGRKQALISQHDFPGACGFGLFINETGEAEFDLGNGGAHESANVVRGGGFAARAWHHVVATWDGRTASVWIDAKKVASNDIAVRFNPGRAPLRLGSSGVEGRADQFLDGDMIMPVIYARTLADSEIARRCSERGLHVAAGRFVIGCWPLAEQRGDTVRDVSGHQRTGRIVNHATWMVNGPAFEPHKVSLYDEYTPAYDPLADVTRGSGIRFARDDLYDCRWDATHEFEVPQTTVPGIYVGRIQFAGNPTVSSYDVTFIVTKARDGAPAPILVLCSTNSWLAYASSPFAENAPANSTWPRRGVGLKSSHPDAPTYNTYTRHHGGQPTYHAGVRMPWPNASPSALYAPEGIGFGQWTRLELYLHLWLDNQGYQYDVISDIELHRNPELLNDYKTVIINGHSEYWSIPAYDGIDRYLRNGGTAIVLSGNTIASRVSFNEDCSVMEQRKTHPDARLVPGSDVEYPGGPHGEQYHSDDGIRGGTLRHAGRSAAHLIGLDTAGWAFAEGRDFGVYEVQMPDHFLFNTPNKIGLLHGEAFGFGANGELPRAIGHEWDLTLHTIKKMTHHVPEGETLPPDHDNIEVIAHGVRKEAGTMDAYLDYFYRDAPSLNGLSCEMIYWERPEGGRIFNAGSVGANWVLGSDPIFGQLLSNVLHHLLQRRPERP